MHPLSIAQSLFVAVLVLMTPWIGLRRTRRLRGHTSTQARIAWYRTTLWKLWILAAVAVLIAYPINLYLLPQHEHVARWLDMHRPLLLIAATAVAAFVIVGLGQGIRAVFDAAWRTKMTRAMRSMQFMLPVSPQERRYFVLLGISAGIGEELLYRGFLMHYLSGSLMSGASLGTAGAWLVSSAFFGLAHAYQGASGIIRAAITGLVLGLVAILTGQLILPILLHALFDLQVLWVYRPMKDDPAAAQELMQGCTPSEV